MYIHVYMCTHRERPIDKKYILLCTKNIWIDLRTSRIINSIGTVTDTNPGVKIDIKTILIIKNKTENVFQPFKIYRIRSKIWNTRRAKVYEYNKQNLKFNNICWPIHQKYILFSRCRWTNIYIYIYIYMGVARGEMDVIAGNGLGDPKLNPLDEAVCI